MNIVSFSASFQKLASDIRSGGADIARSTARLSSGHRITQASDDVANMSVATRMLSRISGLRSGSMNMAQAESVLQVADGALANIEAVLQRMNGLAVQATSGHLSVADRAFLNIEFQTLKEEVGYVLDTTRFGDRLVFRGVETIAPEVVEVSSITQDDPFLPTNISDIITWLDATDEATIVDGAGNDAASGGFSGDVATWFDKSGNNNHVTQGNAGERPTYTFGALNGENVLRFDGNNDRLTGTAPTTTNQLTTFTVFTRTGGGGSREAIFEYGGIPDASRNAIFLTGTNPRHFDASPNTFRNYTGNIVFGDYEIVSSVQNGVNVAGSIDGVEFLNTVTTARTPTTLLTIGDDFTSGDEIHGDIAEQIAFERELTAFEQEQIEGYLAHKYGLQGNLPPTHSFAAAAPVAGAGSTTQTNNIVVGESVGQVALTGGPFTYNIALGNESGAFAINPFSGDITIADVEALGTEDATIELTIAADDGSAVTNVPVSITIDAMDILTKDSSFTYLLGEQSGSTFSFDIGDIFLSDVFSDVNVAIHTEDAAKTAFDDVQQAIDFIIGRRAYVGGKQSQASYVNAVLDDAITNTSAARGVVADTDIAATSTEFATQNAGLQASIRVSVEANELQRDTVLGIIEEGIQLDTLV